jgi:hypothetical protein
VHFLLGLGWPIEPLASQGIALEILLSAHRRKAGHKLLDPDGWPLWSRRFWKRMQNNPMPSGVGLHPSAGRVQNSPEFAPRLSVLSEHALLTALTLAQKIKM